MGVPLGRRDRALETLTFCAWGVCCGVRAIALVK